MKYTIENEQLQVTVNTQGGELQSLFDKTKSREYLWSGDAAYWGRRAPILFPIVGSLRGKSYRHEGVSYPLSQHGFARDMEFALAGEGPGELWFELGASDATRKIYPFDFLLKIGYLLKQDTLQVVWRVGNRGDGTMYFSIGGHPAFMCPIMPGTEQKDYYLRFNKEGSCIGDPISYRKLNDQGLVCPPEYRLEPDQGMVRIDEHMFDEDALIFEHPPFDSVELLTPNREPYLRLTSDMPVFGIWSPAKKNAPFVCLEPWCGRCDAAEFEGELKDREYGQALQPGDTFEKSYQITLL